MRENIQKGQVQYGTLMPLWRASKQLCSVMQNLNFCIFGMAGMGWCTLVVEFHHKNMWAKLICLLCQDIIPFLCSYRLNIEDCSPIQESIWDTVTGMKALCYELARWDWGQTQWSVAEIYYICMDLSPHHVCRQMWIIACHMHVWLIWRTLHVQCVDIVTSLLTKAFNSIF